VIGAKKAIKKCIELLHKALKQQYLHCRADHHWIVEKGSSNSQCIDYFWMRRPIKLWHGERRQKWLMWRESSGELELGLWFI